MSFAISALDAALIVDVAVAVALRRLHRAGWLLHAFRGGVDPVPIDGQGFSADR